MSESGVGVRQGRFKKRIQNRAGQATLEFALTIILILGFAFFFIQLSLAFAWGNYIQYATFMSARAYLSAGPTVQDQVERARNVIAMSVKNQAGNDRLPMVAKGDEGDDTAGGNVTGFYNRPPAQFQKDNRLLSWNEGIRYRFRSRIFMIPLTGKKSSGSPNANTVTLTAESVLGRDPTYEECMQYMRAFGTVGKDVVIDNGC